MYCVQSAPYSLESPFHSPSWPLPPLVSSFPSFGSDASYSRSPWFSPASSSYSPINSSLLTAKHSSSFGPGPSSSFCPGPFLSSYPSEPPSPYSSFRSFVSQVTHSVPPPSSFEPSEHATALTGFHRIGQYAASVESRSIPGNSLRSGVLILPPAAALIISPHHPFNSHLTSTITSTPPPTTLPFTSLLRRPRSQIDVKTTPLPSLLQRLRTIRTPYPPPFHRHPSPYPQS